MLTLYTVLLTLHIMFVVLWVGSGVTLMAVAHRAKDRVTYAKAVEGLGMSWFPALSGLAAVAGVLLWIDGPWGFGEPWLLIAVAGWVASSAIGGGVLGPNSLKLTGADAAEADAAWEKVRFFGRIDQVILFLVIADMVIKPGA